VPHSDSIDSQRKKGRRTSGYNSPEKKKERGGKGKIWSHLRAYRLNWIEEEEKEREKRGPVITEGGREQEKVPSLLP